MHIVFLRIYQGHNRLSKLSQYRSAQVNLYCIQSSCEFIKVTIFPIKISSSESSNPSPRHRASSVLAGLCSLPPEIAIFSFQSSIFSFQSSVLAGRHSCQFGNLAKGSMGSNEGCELISSFASIVMIKVELCQLYPLEFCELHFAAVFYS